MILGNHEDKAVAAERIGFEAPGIDSAGDNAEIGNTFGDQADNLVAQAFFQIDTDARMRGKKRTQRFRQKFRQRIGVRQHADLAGEAAAIGAEILMQALSLAQNGACVLKQRASSLGRRHALSPPRQQSDTERVFHVADAGRGGGKRKMRAFCAVGDAARLDDMAKQAEIGEIKSHGMNQAFVFHEARLCIMPIVCEPFNVMFSPNTK